MDRLMMSYAGLFIVARSPGVESIRFGSDFLQFIRPLFEKQW